MRRLAQLSLLFAGFALAAHAPDSFAQEKGGKKEAPEPKEKDSSKDAPEKGDKGQLPTYWKQLGLSDEQKAKVYKLNAKYAGEIDKLEAQIKEMKAKLAKERNEILDPAQKKKLEEIYKKKSGTDK